MVPAVGQTQQDTILRLPMPPMLLSVLLKRPRPRPVRPRLAGKLSFRLAHAIGLTYYNQFDDSKWQLEEFSRRSSRGRAVGIRDGLGVDCDIYYLSGFAG